jgi:hypothetical protein
VPPTVKLANRHFGERAGPVIFGWVLMGHQAGAAVAAIGAGLVRQQTGSYQPAFILAGIFGVAAAVAMAAFRSTPAPVAAAR